MALKALAFKAFSFVQYALWRIAGHGNPPCFFVNVPRLLLSGHAVQEAAFFPVKCTASPMTSPRQAGSTQPMP